MNLRQKAKKFKKELDRLKSEPFRKVYKVINIESEHLRTFRVIPLEEIERLGDEMIENEVRYQLSNDFIKFIRENMIVNKEIDLEHFHYMKYSSDIFIAFGRR